MFLILLLLLNLVFSVGGTSSGATNNAKQFDLNASYVCPEGQFLINAKTKTGTPISDLTINLFREGTIIKSAITNVNGDVKIPVDVKAQYIISAKGSDWVEQNKIIEIKLCNEKNSTTQQTIVDTNFLCQNEGTIRERVSCVLKLPDDAVKNVRYLPEECRFSENSAMQSCVEKYRLLQTCRDGIETSAERERCIKPKLGISENIREDVEKCKLELGTKKRLCFTNLKENVLTLVKFRMYDLVYKAEELRENGANEADVINFIAFLEEAKIRFNDARLIADKKIIVKEVKEEWDEFKENAKQQIKNRD